eukprot:175104_1
MGKCLSNAAPTDYGELTAGNTEKPTPKTSNTAKDISKTSESDVVNAIPTTNNSTSSITNKYRKISNTESQSTQIDTEYNNININYDSQIEIDENIIIEDFVKIYNYKKDEYEHYGLLLNHKQCRLYLINPHYFQIWKQFEQLTKMNDIITNDRNSNKLQGINLLFNQKDAEDMMNNLIGNKNDKNIGDGINFIMRKNKYLIEKEILLTNKW